MACAGRWSVWVDGGMLAIRQESTLPLVWSCHCVGPGLLRAWAHSSQGVDSDQGPLLLPGFSGPTTAQSMAHCTQLPAWDSGVSFAKTRSPGSAGPQRQVLLGGSRCHLRSLCVAFWSHPALPQPVSVAAIAKDGSRDLSSGCHAL